MKNEKTIKYFSMFTGVGGFELGIGDRAECVGFSEIDKYANQLLATKFPNIKNYGDARKINPRELPNFDMLCGGFPCQAFSIAGKRKGFKDTRGTLFFDIARIIKAKRPKIILLENVKGLLNHNKGKTFKVIIQTLSELGYDVQWMVLNSKFFGVPQNRERVFIIGNFRGEPIPQILPFREITREIPRIFEAKGIAWRTRTYAGKEGDFEMRKDNISNQLTTCQKDAMIYDRKGFDSRTKGFREKEGESPTLSVKMGTGGNNIPMVVGAIDANYFKGTSPTHMARGQIRGVQSENHIRRLTPIECERLQGFPDNWTEGFSDTQRYKMMGNAVTVNVIQAIAGRLLKWKQTKLF